MSDIAFSLYNCFYNIIKGLLRMIYICTRPEIWRRKTVLVFVWFCLRLFRYLFDHWQQTAAVVGCIYLDCMWAWNGHFNWCQQRAMRMMHGTEAGLGHSSLYTRFVSMETLNLQLISHFFTCLCVYLGIKEGFISDLGSAGVNMNFGLMNRWKSKLSAHC